MAVIYNDWFSVNILDGILSPWPSAWGCVCDTDSKALL